MILKFDYFKWGLPDLIKDECRNRLVLACGCFDLLTIGHVRHLETAKKLGFRLLVLVTADEHVNKGPGRPIFPQEARVEMVDALRCVDYTVLNPHPTAVEAIRILRPQVYVKGKEYRGATAPGFLAEWSAVSAAGGVTVFTDTEELHTSDVLSGVLETAINRRVEEGVLTWK